MSNPLLLTESQALSAAINYLDDCIRIGLTIREARAVIRLSIATGSPLPKIIDKIESSSAMRDYLQEFVEPESRV